MILRLFKNFGLFSLLFSSVVFAANTLKTTDLLVQRAPTLAQLEVAKAILSEAIEARKNGDEPVFTEKLKKLKKYLEFQRQKQTFQAAIVTQYDRTKINYFSNPEIQYEVDLATTCYNGSPNEVVNLLKAAISQSMVGSDELWYEKPRVKGSAVQVNLVDGPNDMREVVEIKPCN